MVQEVHPDLGDLEFLELRGGLESLGNLHVTWQTEERTPVSIRTTLQEILRAYDKQSLKRGSVLDEVYLRATRLAERTFECTVVATEDLWDSSQRRALPMLCALSKNSKQFTSETLTS